jgi:hypothetical protein
MRTHAAVVVLLVTACVSDDEPAHDFVEPPELETKLVYVSDRVQVFTRSDMNFCRGDGALIDAHIERVSTLLAIDPPRLPVYVVGYHDADEINEWCFGTLKEDKTLGGCFRNWMAVAQPPFVAHELDHALLHTLNPRVSAAFWQEAYASAWELTESRGTYFDSLPEQNVAGAYSEGQHLVRGLIDAHELEPVRDFYASLESDWQRAEVDAAFADVFGVSYEQMLVQHQAEVPLMYPGLGWCDDVEVIEVPLGETHATLQIDCDAPDTHTFYHMFPIEGMYVRRILRLEQLADLEIEYSSNVAILGYHPCLETPVESDDDPRLSNYAWHEYLGSGEPQTSMGPTFGPDNLPAGDNLFEFLVPFGLPVTVDVTIRAEPAADPP